MGQLTKVSPFSPFITLATPLKFVILLGSTTSTKYHGHQDRGPRGISVYSPVTTQVEGSSHVLNGSGTNTQHPHGTRIYCMHGGSVRNGSIVCNRDLSPEEFRRMFCSGG